MEFNRGTLPLCSGFSIPLPCYHLVSYISSRLQEDIHFITAGSTFFNLKPQVGCITTRQQTDIQTKFKFKRSTKLNWMKLFVFICFINKDSGPNRSTVMSSPLQTLKTNGAFLGPSSYVYASPIGSDSAYGL